MLIARDSVVVLLFVAAVIFLAGVNPVAATTYTVTNTNDSGTGSLRQAVTDAMGTAAADNINFSVSGTITLASDLPNIVSAGGSLTIDGSGQAITVSGGGIARAFYLHDFATLNLLNLAIVNCTKPLNSGGAIEMNSGTLNITNCTFSGNFTEGYGGAIDNGSGTVTIANSIFSGNSSVYGGGAIWSDGTLTITNSTFSGNSNSGTYSAYEGGAIYNSATMTVTNTTFSGNTSVTNSGAISNHSMLTVINSTFSGNTAAVNGGAIWNGGGSLTITNSTFSGNGATDGGGVFQSSGGDATFLNTIVANSTSGGNCGIYDGEVTITNGGNNIDSGTTCGWGSANGSMSNTNPLLGPLQDNGGLTDTMALTAGSPAIDGVTFNMPNGAPSEDQRGVVRPKGLLYDIGAYEYDASFVILPSANYGGSVSCSPNPVEVYWDSVCTITPINDFSSGDFNYISGIQIKPAGYPFWTAVDPTSEFTLSDITTDYYMQVTFAPTTIWLYRYAIFSNPPWEWLATKGTMAAALQEAAVHYPVPDTIRIPYGAYKESGGVPCYWNINVALSGGWTSETTRDPSSPMSTVAGPLTIGSSCSLTMDGITVE